MTRNAAPANRADAPFRGSAEHCGRRPVAHRRPRVDDVVIGFQPGERRPGEIALGTLKLWIDGWLPAQPQAIVVMAHDVSADPTTRLARLRTLRDTIEQLGVPRENVKYTDLPLDALAAADSAEVMADAVMLKLVEPAFEAEEVRPVAACFPGATAADGVGRTKPCTNA